MRQLRHFARFIAHDPFRGLAAAAIFAAMAAAFAGPVPAAIALFVASLSERIALWRSLRLCAGPANSQRNSLAFSAVMLVLRLAILAGLAGKILPPGVAAFLAPLALSIVPLPLAGLFLQQRRMCEIIFPATARELDPRFLKSLRPETAASLVPEWFCIFAILNPPGFGMAFAGVSMAIFTVVFATRFLASPVAARLRKSRFEETAAHLRELAPEIVFYHSGPADSLYQYKMWAPVLERLPLRCLVVFRETGYLAAVPPTPLATIFIRHVHHLYPLLPDSAKVVLYAANGTSNINMLRWNLPAEHVFINHGESDKSVNANYFLTVYSHLFVAGRQAVERLAAARFAIPAERFVIVGRPQVDRLAARISGPDARRTLLYAPTWEGWNPQENYCSLEETGIALIAALLARHPEMRIVYKPHPFTGKHRPAAASASRRIAQMLREAGAHAVAVGADDIMPLLAGADILVTDVSSVASDFLATGLPLVMTDPHALGPEEYRARFPTARAAWILGRTADNLDTILADASGPDSLAAARQTAFEDSLGGFRGNSTEVFGKALADLCREVAARRAGW